MRLAHEPPYPALAPLAGLMNRKLIMIARHARTFLTSAATIALAAALCRAADTAAIVLARVPLMPVIPMLTLFVSAVAAAASPPAGSREHPPIDSTVAARKIAAASV